MFSENDFYKNKDNLLKLLSPRTPLELIFDVDLINNNIDVRKVIVYENNPDNIIISQSEPLMAKSTIGCTVEATFLHRDSVTSEVIRWGWHCQIEKFISNYNLSKGDEEAVTALSLSSPTPDSIIATNARLDYRLRSTEEKRIHIQTNPAFGRVSLLDFSAGGVLIAVPQPVKIPVGKRMWVTLIFPMPNAPTKEATIKGEVEVVRVTILEGVAMAQLALKFVDLDLSSSRTLQKAVNFYMMEEQQNCSYKITPISFPS